MPSVLLDCRMVRGRLHGIARYSLALAGALPRHLPSSWRVTLLTGPDGLDAPRELTPDLPLRRCRAGFLSALEQPALAASLVELAPDLFHATSFSLPLLWGGPLVATLHDANHLALSELYGRRQAAYYRLVVGPRARRARALITDSDFSRQELSKHLALAPERLQVISPGVDRRFAPAADGTLRAFRERHRLPERYLLAVASEKPHKNLALLRQIASRLPGPLVLLAGADAEPIEGTLALRDLGEDELALLYAGARALLLPSRYEGFGLPALEAMAAGCPVVAASVSALPEVLGGAGALVDPDDAEGWLETSRALWSDDARWRLLRDKGLERASRYGWDDCARRVAAVYQRVLPQGASASTP